MTRRVAFLIGAALFAPSILLAAVTLDFPEGPLNLPNAPQIGAAGGEALSLRLSPRGDVVLRRGDVEQRVAEGSRSGGRISLPVLYVDGAGVHTFWRVKLSAPVPEVGNPGDKLIYVRSSTDGGKSFGPPHRLNQQGGAFQPRTAGNGQGAVYAVWADERFGRYHVYLNRTTDGGKTWQARDTQVDVRPEKEGGAYDPVLAATGDHVWVIWAEGNIVASQMQAAAPSGKGTKPEPFVLLLRRSTDRGETWSDPVRVVEPTGQPFSPIVLRASGRLLLYWFTEQGFAGMKSGDDGRTWTAVTGFPKAEPIGGLTGAVDAASGRIILAYGVDREGQRPALWVTSSPDGMQFDAPMPLPTKTPHLTTAILPQIVPGKDGTVMALWQDFRYIRSTVCARLSKDGGRTWLERDTCLEEPPGKFHAFFPKGAADGTGGFFTQWVRYTDDRLHKAEVVLTRVDPGRVPAPPDPREASQARLEERVGGFWKTRVAADWGGSYAFMDPIFRSRVRREAYIGSQGVVKYYDFKIEKLDVTERIAKATVRYTFEIPELEVAPGKRQAVPKRDDPTTQEWVFVDGDWHLVFKDLMNQAFFQY